MRGQNTSRNATTLDMQEASFNKQTNPRNNGCACAKRARKVPRPGNEPTATATTATSTASASNRRTRCHALNSSGICATEAPGPSSREVAAINRDQPYLSTSSEQGSGCALHRGCPGRPDERTLQPSGSVKVIAGPDHPGRGSAGRAILEPQVTADRIDQPAVGQLRSEEHTSELQS